MPVVWRIASSLAAVLLVVALLSGYVGARATWAFRLSKRGRTVLGVLFVGGLVASVFARTLGPEYAFVAAPLGEFAGAVILGVMISAVLLVPVDLARALAALVARVLRKRPPAPSQAKATELSSAAQADTPPSPERRAFVARAATAGALSIGGGASLYGTVFGRHDYTLETVPIRLAKLPRTLDGLTLVQLSDIHVGTFVGERELRAARELVRKAKADAVVLTGDLLDHDLHYAPLLARFAGSLREMTRFGVFAVPGNHDHYAGASQVVKALSAAGVEVLVNRHALLGSGKDALVLGGVDDVAGDRYGGPGPDPERAFANAPEELARVLLSHNPAYFPESYSFADLTLSGHTHGGQITLFINPAELVLRHGLVRGHYQHHQSQLYVNRGFGTAGPPARVGSSPEVTRLVLTS